MLGEFPEAEKPGVGGAVGLENVDRASCGETPHCKGPI